MLGFIDIDCDERIESGHGISEVEVEAESYLKRVCPSTEWRISRQEGKWPC